MIKEFTIFWEDLDISIQDDFWKMNLMWLGKELRVILLELLRLLKNKWSVILHKSWRYRSDIKILYFVKVCLDFQIQDGGSKWLATCCWKKLEKITSFDTDKVKWTVTSCQLCHRKCNKMMFTVWHHTILTF